MTEYIYTLTVKFKLDAPLTMDDVGDFLKAIFEIIPEGREEIVEVEFSRQDLCDELDKKENKDEAKNTSD